MKSFAIALFSFPFALIAMSAMGGWGMAALMIGALIFLHELGHFAVAKWMGMPVEIFSLGFGPRLIGFSWRETDVRLSVLPLGGYVKLAGFNPEEPEAEDPHGFLQQPVGKRLLFFSGGILANVLTAFVLLSLLGIHGSRLKPTTMKVVELVKGGAAEAGGLQLGDDVKRIGTMALPETPWDSVIAQIQTHPGEKVAFQVRRGASDLTLELVPKLEGGKGKLGFRSQAGDFINTGRPFAVGDFTSGLSLGLVRTWEIGGEVFKGYFRLFTFQANFKELGGPLTIARVGRDAAQAGWVAYLFVTALISMNLAVLNALPIPFLDGGHMAMLIFEKTRGRDLSVTVKERILTGGAVFLAGLMMLVIVMDLWRLKH